MQRYQIPQSPLLLKPARGAAEGAEKSRNARDGSLRSLYRPVTIKEAAAGQQAAVQPSSTMSPSSATSSSGPIARFFSRMIEQLVNDFASGAAATHPEAYLMWLEFNETSRTAAQDESGPVGGTSGRYSLYTQAERRADMHAYPSQPQPISAPKTFRPSLNVMDETPIHQDEPSQRRWPSALKDFITGRIQQMRETRRGIAALYSMDDRMLKDIGISRYEIEQVARYGRPRK